MPRFGAVVTAMVTPFDATGGLDLDAAGEVARWLVHHGSDGLAVAATTGEGPTLADDERLDLFRAVRESVDVPLIAGATTNDTRHSIALSEAAATIGMDGILAVTPYYNRPSQAGIEAHFRAIAAATPLPVVLYDVPARTGRAIAPETIVRLSHEVPAVVGLKDAAGDPAQTFSVMAEAAEGFEVYSGDDAITLALVALGAVGTVGVATHWCGREHGEMIAAAAAGDLVTARAINRRCRASYAFENTDVSPYSVSTKAMMRVLGLPVGECRLPLPPTPPGVEDAARLVAAGLGLAVGV